VLENHHLASAFNVILKSGEGKLDKDDNCNIL